MSWEPRTNLILSYETVRLRLNLSNIILEPILKLSFCRHVIVHCNRTWLWIAILLKISQGYCHNRLLQVIAKNLSTKITSILKNLIAALHIIIDDRLVLMRQFRILESKSSCKIWYGADKWDVIERFVDFPSLTLTAQKSNQNEKSPATSL